MHEHTHRYIGTGAVVAKPGGYHYELARCACGAEKNLALSVEGALAQRGGVGFNGRRGGPHGEA